jgi:glucose-6-phosphate isomerase
MLPRRQGEAPLTNRVVEREMRELHARLETMEATQRRAPNVRDVSDAESEEIEVEEAGGRAKIAVPMYEGNLDIEELLDWIRSMDKHFDYEDVDEEKKVKHAVTRLKGHATLWWDELQAERRSKGKQRIKSWDIMLAKLKAKFIPKDY